MTVLRARWAAMAAVGTGVVLAMPAIAQAERFEASPGRLGDVAATLGAQAGITITVTDPVIAARRSPGVRGARSVSAALTEAIKGTGADFVFYDRKTVRIMARKIIPPKEPKRPVPVRTPIETAEVPGDIIVMASKQGTLLDSFPGSVKLMEFDAGWLARNAGNGSAAIAELLPTMGSTNLGPGRDKLFIRGIADSSFSGQTQATVGQYLGEVRLNYSAPDPDLNLYDMERVEILVGPQGTLYGASALGGIMRFVPNAPATDRIAATASAGLSSTRSGGVGGDGAAMLNIPIAADRIALRIVAFGAREAGYIDDPSRNLRDINTTRSFGQRVTLRIADLSGWTVDIGGVEQNITSRDGQYTIRGDPPLTRATAIAQPFRDHYHLGYVTARRPLGRGEIVTTASVVEHDFTTVFDATGYLGTTSPLKFEETNAIRAYAYETRVSGGGQRSPWVAGVAGIHNVSRLSRSVGVPDALEQIAGVRNRQMEFALFGQASQPLTRTLTATAGVRVTLARSAGSLLDKSKNGSKEPSSTALPALPSFAVDWQPSRSFSSFVHFQKGFRAGGLAVAPSGDALDSRKFVADDLSMTEFGVRWGRRGEDRLSIRAAIFFADWNHIQADLVDTSGLPYTANVGDGRVYGLDAEITWRLSSAITLTGAAFVNNSKLYAAEADFGTSEEQTLPNVPRNGTHAAATWQKTIAEGVNLSADVSVRYIGQSRLGVGPVLNIPQGRYAVGDLGGRLGFDRFGVSLDIDNIGDVRANSFAFGNPFSVAERNQMTPLRPRTIRLGFDVRF